jgi:hypothetical protein
VRGATSNGRPYRDSCLNDEEFSTIEHSPSPAHIGLIRNLFSLIENGSYPLHLLQDKNYFLENIPEIACQVPKRLK